jgi:hypothetical protein
MHATQIVLTELANTLYDLVPILAVFAVFQLGIMRAAVPRLKRMLLGLFYVLVGLTFFRIGLSLSFIPIGGDIARQLVESAATGGSYLFVLAFAALIGVSATLIEPTLTAAATRVSDLSGGVMRPWPFRFVVALGVGAGLALGAFRIVHGVPIEYVLGAAVGVLCVLVLLAPRGIVPLALDSGGIATSVVTVPLIAAFGVAVAETVPGRGALTDGFGLIVLALLCPAIMLLAFAAVQAWWHARPDSGGHDAV